MKSRIFTGAALAAVLLATTGCGSKAAPEPAAGTTGALTLGASLSLTGATAKEGGLTKEGYEVCRKVINDKGGIDVGGKKYTLDIQYQDDTSKADVSAQLVDQYNDKGVKLILGPYGSGPTEAAAAVIERNGQLMAVSAGADNKIFKKGYQRSFAVLSPATSYVGSMVQAINDLATPKPKTLAFVSADDGFSKTATQGGIDKAKELGFQVVAVEYVPNQTTDVSAALTKIKPLKPDVIIGSVHLSEGVALIKQAKELGVVASGFAETVAPPIPDFAKSLGASAEGVLGSTQWTDRMVGKDDYFGTAADYAKTFATQYGDRKPVYQNAQATAACLALTIAVQKAGTTTDMTKVRATLAALDIQSFFGPIRFTPEGMNVTKPMAVIQIQNGKPVTVWPKDSAAGPLVWPVSK